MTIRTSYSFILDATNNKWVPLSGISSGSIPEPIVPGGLLLPTLAYNLGFDGANWERVRVANIFQSVRVDGSGDPEILWAAVPGKRIRVMGIAVSVAGTLEETGVLNIDVSFDGGGPFWQGNATLSDTLIGDTQMGVDFGQGKLATNVNTALVAEFSDTISDGDAAISVWGTVE
jgi:hypothetical protein